jgi:serine/threonine protein kinase
MAKDYEIPRDFFVCYEPIEVLGRGATGLVVKALSLPGRHLCAVKIIRKQGESWLGSELEILRRLDHPCVVKLLDLKETDHYLFLSLELAEAGTLGSYLSGSSGFSEDRTRLVLRRVLEGLAYLHEQGIIHRDIKPGTLGNKRQHPARQVTAVRLGQAGRLLAERSD